jgi:hypothetical protein
METHLLTRASIAGTTTFFMGLAVPPAAVGRAHPAWDSISPFDVVVVRSQERGAKEKSNPSLKSTS